MPQNGDSVSQSILIVGAGTWGLSTALFLSRRHPSPASSITVFDPYPIPSAISAGNDINKILDLYPGCTDASKTLFNATMRGWRDDPVFSPYFHETGIVIAASSREALEHVRIEEGIDDAPDGEWAELTTASQFRGTMPQGVLTGDLPGWKGWSKGAGKGAGWVAARSAMLSAFNGAKRNGVKFITGGQAGHVASLIVEDGDVKGARTADGKEHRADKIILSAGANAPQIQGLNFHGQLLPKAWTLAHIKLTPEECELYKDLPVLFNCQRGFFLEPDEENGEVKICDEHPGYCNWIAGDDENADKGPHREDGRVDIPFARQQIPKEAEDRVRLFLRETMPHLAERALNFARICWCADTPDREFLICKHPEFESLTLAVGGSGHGFVYISCIGQFVVDEMEGKLDEKLVEIWRWRPESAAGRDWRDLQGRYGPKGSNRVMDLREVKRWTDLHTR